LQDELADARQEIARLKASQGPPDGAVQVDTQTGDILIKNLKTPDFTVTNLRARLPDAPAALSEAISLPNLLDESVKNPLAGLQKLADAPVEVQELALRIPASTALTAVHTLQDDTLNAYGVNNLSLKFEPGNEVALKGKLHFIPFNAKAKLTLADAQHARISIMNVGAGILPIPKPVKSLIIAVVTGMVNGRGIEPESDSTMKIDIGAFVPPTMNMGLQSLSTENGELVVTAGPGEAPPPA
jgi:hypothetical protein